MAHSRAERSVSAAVRDTGSSPRTPREGGGKPEHGGSLFTVLIAFAANVLIAIAKSVAAVLTGSASMVAEAAHSWADSGNEVFLLIAERKAGKKPDPSHPLGFGRDAYVWSMFAAFGLFSAGAVVSIWHGIQSLAEEGEQTDPLVAYLVLAIAFVLEGVSFFQATRQTRGQAASLGLHPLRFITRTSDPTLRAVFIEDGGALIGILLAGAGILLHQLTGSAVYDAFGSIAVGLVLAVMAIFLIARNREFLVGQPLGNPQRDVVLRGLLEDEEVERVTYLHLEFVGPGRIFLVAAVDLAGDRTESEVAERLRAVEARLESQDRITEAVLTLATRDERPLVPESPATSP
ncbi:cation diffusion facilitator transporter [Tersicoccus solisilvae]|uniref:Cation diffusion facilitator transporter n=1 Tax=Tersicoccus solisilvae TaxID=1882339 RepID=A0ABQ1NHU1_9MICC|nr:cation transporter [Tersicoccus solisilvae]GGC77511.1 cation diffusion facilitator transporter [Tersicoccus solisilvae]